MDVAKCSCHARTKRRIHFETSCQNGELPCWCGLILSSCCENGGILQSASSVSHTGITSGLSATPQSVDATSRVHSIGGFECPQVPVYLNAPFWKAPIAEVISREPELAALLRYRDSTKFCYFVSNYLIGPEIGRGTRSKVRHALVKMAAKTWTPVALKWYFRGSCRRQRVPIFDATGLQEIVSGWDRVQAEWALYATLRHPNIARFVELLWNSKHDVWFVAMEYGAACVASYDPNYRLYRQPTQSAAITASQSAVLGEKAAQHIIRELLQAVKHMQLRQLVHKDIKPDNVVLTHPVPKDWIQLVPLCSSRHQDRLDGREVLAKPSQTTFDWEAVSDCTEHFLWDTDDDDDENDTDMDSTCLTAVQSLYDQNINSIDRLSSPHSRWCLCCALARASVRDDSVSDDEEELPRFFSTPFTEQHDQLELETPASVLDTAACACCHHPLAVDALTSQADVGEENAPLPHARLIDFSLSLQTAAPLHLIHDAEGTRHFTPPEFFTYCTEDGANGGDDGAKRYGFPRDMWSIGCLVHCILIGHLPFDADTALGVIVKITQMTRLPLPEWLSSAARDFIWRLLNPNPLSRLTVDEALRHPWIAPIPADLCPDDHAKADAQLDN